MRIRILDKKGKSQDIWKTLFTITGEAVCSDIGLSPVLEMLGEVEDKINEIGTCLDIEVTVLPKEGKRG